jgi:hypothetical protein
MAAEAALRIKATGCRHDTPLELGADIGELRPDRYGFARPVLLASATSVSRPVLTS